MLEYHGRAADSRGKLPLIEDIGEIGPIVDYEIPRGYRAKDFLRYSPALAEIVAEGEAVASGSQPEIEVRGGVTYIAANRLSTINSIKKKHGLPEITFGQLDPYDWKAGMGVPDNYLLCISTNY